LTGIPPFSGFIAKWYIFAAIIQKGMYSAAIAAVINTVISLFYYAKIVRTMFFDKQPTGAYATIGATQMPLQSMVITTILVVPTVILGVFWEQFYQFSKNAIFMFGVQ